MLSLVSRFIELKADYILYFISILGVLLCLSPLFVLHTLYVPSEKNYINLSYDLVSDQSIIASLFIVIIPLVDVLLDFCQNIWDWYKEKIPQKRQHNDIAIYRLTEGERFIFIIGMILQSTVSFLPSSDTDIIDVIVIYHCTRTAAQIFFIVPILFYFKRCTTTFNTWIMAAILVPYITGLILFSLKIMHRSDPLMYDQLQQYSLVFKSLGVALFLSTVFTSFSLFLIEKYLVDTNRPFCTNLFMNSICNFLLRSKLDESQIDNNVDFMFTHLIPAFHMISYIIMSVGGLLRVADVITLEEFSITSLFGQTIVLVIELRIRKNEIARGLVIFLV